LTTSKRRRNKMAYLIQDRVKTLHQSGFHKELPEVARRNQSSLCKPSLRGGIERKTYSHKNPTPGPTATVTRWVGLTSHKINGDLGGSTISGRHPQVSGGHTERKTTEKLTKWNSVPQKEQALSIGSHRVKSAKKTPGIGAKGKGKISFYGTGGTVKKSEHRVKHGRKTIEVNAKASKTS